jgi:tetratricopeptide (TPR) repeat protein
LTVSKNVADSYVDNNRLADAIPLFQSLLERRQTKLGPNHRDTINSRFDLAEAYQLAGRLTEALPLYEQAYQENKSARGPDHPATLTYLTGWAGAVEKAGDLTKAEGMWRQLLDIRRKQAGSPKTIVSTVLGQLGWNLLLQNKPAAAEPILRECLAIREKEMEDTWLRFNAECLLGASLLDQKKYADAEPLLIQGYEGMLKRRAQISAKYQPRLMDALQRVVRLYEAWGKKDQAMEWRKKEVELKSNSSQPNSSNKRHG